MCSTSVYAVLLELEGCSGRAAQVPELPAHHRHQVALGIVSREMEWTAASASRELLHVAVQSGALQHCLQTLAIQTVCLVLTVHCSSASSNCLLLNSRSRSLNSLDAFCLRTELIVHSLSHQRDTHKQTITLYTFLSRCYPSPDSPDPDGVLFSTNTSSSCQTISNNILQDA